MAKRTDPGPDPVVNNERLFNTFQKKLASDDENAFIDTATRLTKWLSSDKAYYDGARPRIVDMLQTARETLDRVNGNQPPQASSSYPHPMQSRRVAYVKLVQQVLPFYKRFSAEPELQARLHDIAISVGFQLNSASSFSYPASINTGSASPPQVSSNPPTRHQSRASVAVTIPKVNTMIISPPNSAVPPITSSRVSDVQVKTEPDTESLGLLTFNESLSPSGDTTESVSAAGLWSHHQQKLPSTGTLTLRQERKTGISPLKADTSRSPNTHLRSKQSSTPLQRTSRPSVPNEAHLGFAPIPTSSSVSVQGSLDDPICIEDSPEPHDTPVNATQPNSKPNSSVASAPPLPAVKPLLAPGGPKPALMSLQTSVTPSLPTRITPNPVPRSSSSASPALGTSSASAAALSAAGPSAARTRKDDAKSSSVSTVSAPIPTKGKKRPKLKPLPSSSSARPYMSWEKADIEWYKNTRGIDSKPGASEANVTPAVPVGVNAESQTVTLTSESPIRAESLPASSLPDSMLTFGADADAGPSNVAQLAATKESSHPLLSPLSASVSSSDVGSIAPILPIVQVDAKSPVVTTAPQPQSLSPKQTGNESDAISIQNIVEGSALPFSLGTTLGEDTDTKPDIQIPEPVTASHDQQANSANCSAQNLVPQARSDLYGVSMSMEHQPGFSGSPIHSAEITAGSSVINESHGLHEAITFVMPLAASPPSSSALGESYLKSTSDKIVDTAAVENFQQPSMQAVTDVIAMVESRLDVAHRLPSPILEPPFRTASPTELVSTYPNPAANDVNALIHAMDVSSSSNLGANESLSQLALETVSPEVGDVCIAPPSIEPPNTISLAAEPSFPIVTSGPTDGDLVRALNGINLPVSLASSSLAGALGAPPVVSDQAPETTANTLNSTDKVCMPSSAIDPGQPLSNNAPVAPERIAGVSLGPPGIDDTSRKRDRSPSVQDDDQRPFNRRRSIQDNHLNDVFDVTITSQSGAFADGPLLRSHNNGISTPLVPSPPASPRSSTPRLNGRHEDGKGDSSLTGSVNTSSSLFGAHTVVPISVKQGATAGGSVLFEFSIAPEQASLLSLWSQREAHKEDVSGCMCLSLACYHTGMCTVVGDDCAGTQLTELLLSLRSSWPSHLNFWVTVDSEAQEANETILCLSPPPILTAENFVDISPFIKGGKSTVKVSCSVDSTDYLLVLYAHPPTWSQLQLLREKRANDHEWKDLLASIARPIDLPSIHGSGPLQIAVS